MKKTKRKLDKSRICSFSYEFYSHSITSKASSLLFERNQKNANFFYPQKCSRDFEQVPHLTRIWASFSKVCGGSFKESLDKLLWMYDTFEDLKAILSCIRKRSIVLSITFLNIRYWRFHNAILSAELVRYYGFESRVFITHACWLAAVFYNSITG